MDYEIVAGVGPNKVLVVGAGKTGIAVARFCQLRGAQVTVTDMRTGAELHAAMQALGERVTWELGKHSLKFGVDFARVDVVNRQNSNPYRGSFSFDGRYSGNSFADFLLGYPTSATSGIGRPI